MTKIRKAIITAAGRGTRFLPVSKAFQKEMVPIMNKPQLQWVIEEALDSGITDIAVVVREGVETFKNYLNYSRSLWRFLKDSNKEHLMESWVNLKHEAKITLFYQKNTDPYGNGTPFILARKFIKDEPFVAMWGDDIIVKTDEKKPSCIQHLINYYEKYDPIAVLSAKKVKRSEISRYGSYEYFKRSESKIPFHVKRVVEKPNPEEAPSLYANACRFILTPTVMEELLKKIPGKDNELWLTDAVERLVARGETVLAVPFPGNEWIPVGDPINWLRANIVLSVNKPEYRTDVINILRSIKY
ncbi:hypothetical protein JW962_02425 [Candidatus Dojkabacteria bacterium]|nr:hypothetical protein [Candidatus Dojkabacteria bacterium]